MNRLPGLIDPHVHMREPGAVHKEDWLSGSRAAVAGGFTVVLAMPNTIPAIINRTNWETTVALAEQKSCIDFRLYAGAVADDIQEVLRLAGCSAGLKLYLDQTYGPLRLDNPQVWLTYLQTWPVSSPLAVHAEGRTLALFLEMVEQVRRPVHICHVATEEDILLIKKAKQAGLPVTCEVTPHHLFLTENDLSHLPIGYSEVRPKLATKKDQQALWKNMMVIDCFVSDHAPHTVKEKQDKNPPPGFPGLETSLPLLLTAVSEGRLSLEDVIQRCYVNPKRIFNLPYQPDTWLEVDLSKKWTIEAKSMFTRSAWTPFEGMPVVGAISRVVFYGQEVFRKGCILAEPGTGHHLFPFGVEKMTNGDDFFYKESSLFL